MTALIEKIFMCQRHQLIRWGKPAGMMGIGFGLLFCLGSILIIYTMELKLKPLLANNHTQSGKILLQIKDVEELRSYALKVHKQMRITESTLLGLTRTVVIFIFSFGTVFVSYGVLSLRARELAMESKSGDQFVDDNPS
jgi:hypothetical protein